MKSFILYLFLGFVGCSSTPVIKEKTGEVSTPEVKKALPKSCFINPSYLKSWSLKNQKQFLDNPDYDVVYDNENIQPFIVVYELKYSHDTHNLKRDSDYSNKFIPDERVKNSARDIDYKKSGWDKGHLAPAKDFCFDGSAARSTFLYSNISPQNPYFNRNGSWKKLEEKVRKISEESNEPIQIISGPIFEQNKRIKDNAPTIPDYFFKTIIKKEGDHCTYIRFILKNDSQSKDFCRDQVPVDLTPPMVKSHLKDLKAKPLDICNTK